MRYKVQVFMVEKFSLKGTVILIFCILLRVPGTITKESVATIHKLRGAPSLPIARNKSFKIMRFRPDRAVNLQR